MTKAEAKPMGNIMCVNTRLNVLDVAEGKSIQEGMDHARQISMFNLRSRTRTERVQTTQTTKHKRVCCLPAQNSLEEAMRQKRQSLQAIQYSHKLNNGGISSSTLVVKTKSQREAALRQKYCVVCPNRIKKLTNIDSCDVLRLKVIEGWNDEKIKVEVYCDHMSLKARKFFNNLSA